MATPAGAAVSPVLAVRLQAVIDARRHALRQSFGWTRLEVAVAVDAPARRIRAEGRVLLPAMAAALRRDLVAHLPRGWGLDARLEHTSGTAWCALPSGVTCLQRRLPALDGAVELVTELLAGDGPVRPLATHGGATLVQAVDGAIGWMTRPLGPPVPRPRHLRRAPDLAALAGAARSYRDVPYRLGGTTRQGIDCSGLVQRAMRAAAGVAVPRHSTDQVPPGGVGAGALGEPGDLVCIWSGARQAPHVGVVLRGRRPADRTVVHASSSARRVVEEPLDRFLAHADRVAHVRCAQAMDMAACLHP